MLFSSLVFILVFLPILILCYFVIPKKYVAAKRYVLMFFSFVFYASGEPVYFFAILACVFITWALSGKIAQRSKIAIGAALLVNIVPLIIFKYLNFIVLNLNLLPFLNIPEVNLVMPIGISFYTFQMLTYVIDLYRGEVDRQKNFGYLALYIFLFPQLIAGPIVRYIDIEKALSESNEDLESIKEGVGRFIKGLAKKVLIANQVCYICDTITALDRSSISVPLMWVAILAYTLQIYFDFSGYSDMAIGLGRVFGFRFLENFNLPYASTSVTEFWRRWHISMNTFFRDYVYIPMGGNRVTQGRWVFNVLVVWALTGLWHGASWNFIVWGLYYAVLLILEKYVLKKILNKAGKFVSWCYTFFITMIGWSFFMNDSNSIREMFSFTGRLFGIGEVTTTLTIRSLGLESYIPYMIIALVLASPIRLVISGFINKIRPKAECCAAAIGSIYRTVYYLSSDIIHVAALAISIFFIIGGSYNPFIYFRF